MTSEQLRKILSVRATSRFGERIGRLIARESLLAETIDLGTDPDPRIAFRASYALEYAFAADPKRMEPHLSAFVDRYAEVSCHGAQRHFSKILALLLRQKSLRLDDRRLDRTIEVTFDRMIDRQIRSLIEYEYIHRKVSNFGLRGMFLCAVMLSPKLFVSVKVWYPMKEKVSSEFFKCKRKYYSLYDTYLMLDAPE